jgi:glycosyltransferase involved in cell wall biosynthesis
MPLNVSVIVAVRNGEKYLADALNSILAQTHPVSEILVIDDGSTDRSAEIAESFAKVRLIRQDSLGAYAAHNRGIRAARGEWIAFLDHDDIWLPRKLEKQIHALEADPNLGYSITRFRFFLQEGSSIPVCFKEALLEGNHVGRLLSTLVAKRSMFDEIGHFDTSYRCAGDVDWFARAKDEFRAPHLIDECLMEKRIHETNLSNLALINSREMLRALKNSVQRRRQARSGT